jgi:pimeloyl-ACP methyl ester carboxylesterase
VVQSKHRSRLPMPQPAVVHVRRSYAEGRAGQIHLATAYPSGGGFDERVPIVCLHQAGGSNRSFAPVLRELGRDRSVYAVDLPGHGSSDASGARVTIVELAAVVGDFLDSLRLRSADVIGYELGAAIATELAIVRAQQIRRLILWGAAVYSPQDRSTLISQCRSSWREDGSDVAELWRHEIEQRAPELPIAALIDALSDRLRAGPAAARCQAAFAEYPAGERLPLVKQHTLVLRLKDQFGDYAPRVRSALPNGTLLDVPEHGHGFISSASQKFAAIVREFFDR